MNNYNKLNKVNTPNKKGKETIVNPVLVESMNEMGKEYRSYIIILSVSDKGKTAEYETYTLGLSRTLTHLLPVQQYKTEYYSHQGHMIDSLIPKIKKMRTLRIAGPREIGELVNLLNNTLEFSDDRAFLRKQKILKHVTYQKNNNIKKHTSKKSYF